MAQMAWRAGCRGWKQRFGRRGAKRVGRPEIDGRSFGVEQRSRRQPGLAARPAAAGFAKRLRVRPPASVLGDERQNFAQPFLGGFAAATKFSRVAAAHGPSPDFR